MNANSAETVQDTETTEIQKYEEQAKALVPHDEPSERQAMLFVAEAKKAQNRVEDKRKLEVEPYNAKVKEINNFYKPVSEAFEKLWRTMEGRLNDYRRERAKMQAEAQRKAIEEANRKRTEEEAKAEAARKAAEAARVSGDEKLAAKLEAKAEKADVKASMVAPEIVSQPVKRMDFADSSVSFRKDKDWMLPAGLTKEAAYYRDDVRLKDLPDDLFVLDMKKVAKLVKAGAKIKGIEVIDIEKAVVRGQG